MKEQTYPCMAQVGTAQCKNRTKTPDYRCARHKNVPQSQNTPKSLIPPVAGAQQGPVLKPKEPSNFDESFWLKTMAIVSSLSKKKQRDILKDRYIKRPKDPKDYSGAFTPASFADKTFECLTTGLMTANPWMATVGVIAGGFAAAALFSAARFKYGVLDVENNPKLRRYDIMLPDPELRKTGVNGFGLPKFEFPDYEEAAKVERTRVENEAKKRVIRIRSEKTRRIVEEHWLRLEEKAKAARGSFINDIESSVGSGAIPAALLYESFREQFYLIGAEPNPITAALQRADEIESYPQSDDSLFMPYPPFVVRGISDEERVAAKDIVAELRSMAESLKLQSRSNPLG